MAVVLVGIWTGHHLGGFSWQSDPKHEFNWHPLLMTLGMIYLYGNGNYSNVKPNSFNFFYACIVFFYIVPTFLQKIFFSQVFASTLELAKRDLWGLGAESWFVVASYAFAKMNGGSFW